MDDRGGRGGRGRGRGGRGGRRDRDYEDTRIIDEVDSRLQQPPVTQQIDINCVQDFPSLNGPGPGMGGEGGGGGGGSNSMATHLAKQNRLTIRSTGSRNMSEEEFPSLGSTSVTVSTAQATAHAPASPTTSVHLKVNTKKALKEGQGSGQRSSNVSIQYNRTIPAAAANHDTTDSDNKENNSKVKGAQIGGISHSSNITLQSKANKANNNNNTYKEKSKPLDEDFPALSISKSNNHSSLGWGSTVAPPTSMPVSSKPLNVTKNDFPSLGPSMRAPSVVPSKPSKPGKKFTSSDFPSLAANSESQTQMRNYHGCSSVTIPVSNAWTNSVEQVPKPSEAGENVSGTKGNKKKKKGNKATDGNSGGGGSNASQGNMSNGTSKPPPSKKKPRGLHNIFDDSDDENGVKTDLSMGKLGDYESVAPASSSNMQMITSDMLNERKKSELKIGSLQKPPPMFDSEDAFPTLGVSAAPPLSTSTWSSPPKKAAPPGFFTKPKVPPGFSATDMTFTSSSGEKFAISPTSETAVSSASFAAQPTASYTFHLPPNFESRNKALIRTIFDECRGDDEKFECFKKLAGALRSGDLHGHSYYEQCRNVMGKASFHKILPELLVLLPDIKKQQEVLAAYRKVDGGRGCTTLFAVCVVCKQVLCQDDFSQHMETHGQTAEFPSLSQMSAQIARK